jgi:hypothetical protein
MVGGSTRVDPLASLKVINWPTWRKRPCTPGPHQPPAPAAPAQYEQPALTVPGVDCDLARAAHCVQTPAPWSGAIALKAASSSASKAARLESWTRARQSERRRGGPGARGKRTARGQCSGRTGQRSGSGPLEPRRAGRGRRVRCEPCPALALGRPIGGGGAIDARAPKGGHEGV